METVSANFCTPEEASQPTRCYTVLCKSQLAIPLYIKFQKLNPHTLCCHKQETKMNGYRIMNSTTNSSNLNILKMHFYLSLFPRQKKKKKKLHNTDTPYVATIMLEALKFCFITVFLIRNIGMCKIQPAKMLRMLRCHQQILLITKLPNNYICNTKTFPT